MAEEQLQCPECGDLIGVDAEDRNLVCHLCDARLQVGRGRSGRAVAKPALGPPPDQPLYEQTGYSHLWAQLQELYLERAGIEAQRRQALEAGQSRLDLWVNGVATAATIVLLVLAAVLGDTWLALMAGFLYIVGRAASYVTRQMIENRLNAIRQTYRPLLQDVDRRIEALQRQLESIQAEIDRMSSQPGAA